MDVLSIGQLENITGGQLLLGNMPPLGGHYEPVQRILHETEQTGLGDVVFHTSLNANRCCALDSAYDQGALGVITHARLTPWDGRFSLQVTTPHSAVQKLAQWTRTQWASIVTLIITPPGISVSASQQAIDTALRPVASPGPNLKDLTTRPWLWPLIACYRRPGHVLLTAEADRIQRHDIAACRPNIVVLSPEWVATKTVNATGDRHLDSRNLIARQRIGALPFFVASLSEETLVLLPEQLTSHLRMRNRHIRPYRNSGPTGLDRAFVYSLSQMLEQPHAAVG